MCAMGVHRNERCGASTMRASITLHTARERYLDSSVAGTDASSINPRLANCATPLLLARPHISTLHTFCAKAHQGCCTIYIFKQRIVAALHASLTSVGEKQCDRRHRSCQCHSSFEIVFIISVSDDPTAIFAMFSTAADPVASARWFFWPKRRYRAKIVSANLVVN
jgi:hypothetical protein